MGYNSILRPGELVIGGTGDTPKNVGGGGYFSRDWYACPLGSMPYAKPYDGIRIPRSEWMDRLAVMESTGSRLSDLIDEAKIPVKDQRSTNYCWAFATVSAIEVNRATQNQPLVPLSPASVAAPITRYRNVGGWGSMALEYIISDGIVPSSMWSDIAIDRRLDTPESREARKLNKCTEWWDIDSRDFDTLMSCLFTRTPVSGGYNHMRHQVMLCDPVYVEGQWGVRYRNSWGRNWGSNGYGILLGPKAIADDAVAPRVAIAA